MKEIAGTTTKAGTPTTERKLTTTGTQKIARTLTIRDAKNQDANNQGCQQSGMPTIWYADNLVCQQSGMPTIRDANNQGCQQSGMPTIMDAKNQGCQQSGMPTIRDANKHG
jgi:uncharacterized protein YqkB